MNPPRSPLFCRGDLQLLGVLAGVAAALFIAALLYSLGAILMKRSPLLLALAAGALALSACSTIGGLPPAERVEVLKGAAEHIERCDRDYWANTGLPGSAGFRITCRQPQDPGALAKAVAAAVKEALGPAIASAAANPAPDASR